MRGKYDFRVLRILRQKKKLTLEALSQASGLSYPTVASIESNKAFPSLKTLDSLATALEIPVSRIISLTEYNLVQRKTTETIDTQMLKSSGINLETLRMANFKGLEIMRLTVKAGNVIDAMKYHNQKECIELCYCLEGEIEIKIKNDKHLVNSNDIIIFNGCLQHEYTAIQTTECLIIHFPKDKDFLEQLIRDKRIRCAPNEFPV